MAAGSPQTARKYNVVEPLLGHYHDNQTAADSVTSLQDVLPQRAAVQTQGTYLASAVQVLLVLGELVQRQEGVAVAGGAVADAVAFSQQAPLPDDLRAVCRLLQVLLLFEHLEAHGAKPLVTLWEEEWIITKVESPRCLSQYHPLQRTRPRTYCTGSTAAFTLNTA